MRTLNRKNVVLIVLAIVLLIVCIVGGIYMVRINEDNSETEPTVEEIVSGRLNAYNTDLLDSLNSFTSNEAVANYLVNWGKHKQIKAVKDEYNNVIFTIKAAEGYEDAAPVAILCGYDASDMESYVDSLSTALTIAKSGINNGRYTVIFSPEENRHEAELTTLPDSCFTDDTELFYLGHVSESKVASVTGGYREYRLSKKLKYEKPDYNKAYKISIKNLPGGTFGSKINQQPNAIKTLGNLIANFKSTSLLFELSSFRGGDKASAIPASASMTIVINGTDTAKFQTKMENAITKFYDKYQDAYPEIEYTYEEVDLPSKVITKVKTDNIVSLMYTAFNGVYSKDDDGNVSAVNNIGRISTRDGKLIIDIASMSSSQELLDEISETYQTISGLCSVNFKCRIDYPIFDGGEKSQLFMDKFEIDFKEFTGDDSMKVTENLEATPCTLLAEKNSSMSILYCGVTGKTAQKFAGSIITYLDNELQLHQEAEK